MCVCVCVCVCVCTGAGGCAHISKHGRAHACPSVCVRASVFLRMFAHAWREMFSVISRAAPARGRRNWVTALCKLGFGYILYAHTKKQTHTHTHKHMRTHTSKPGFRGWIVRLWSLAQMWQTFSWIITESTKETIYLTNYHVIPAPNPSMATSFTLLNNGTYLSLSLSLFFFFSLSLCVYVC